MNKLLMLLFLIPFLLPLPAAAATINAASCSQQDVQAAIDLASNGDIVTVPEGNCVWVSGRRFVDSGYYRYPSLGINKSVVLIGAGADKTFISVHNSGNNTIIYRPANMQANLPFRVSGFAFDMANSHPLMTSSTE